MAFSLAIWGLAAAGLVLSLTRSREKTFAALRFFGRSLSSLGPSVLAIIWAIGFLMTFLPPQLIMNAIGRDAGVQGVVLAAVFGSLVLIPAFVAFPLAASLLRQGADVQAIAAFVTTLVMVGAVTAPLEVKCFGRAFTLWRNSLSFLFALGIAFAMGMFLR